MTQSQSAAAMEGRPSLTSAPRADRVAHRFIRALAPKMSPTEQWLFGLAPAPVSAAQNQSYMERNAG